MKVGEFGRPMGFLLFASVMAAGPAASHNKKHHGHPAPVATQARQNAPEAVTPAAPLSEADEMAAGMREAAAERAAMSTGERLLDWLGRLHPIIVHFPLAFFPAALVTAVVGRRRPAFGKPVQFLVVAGGIIAPIAAILGWFDGGMTMTDTDWLLHIHRWLGTAIGIGGLALAVWAVRKPEKYHDAGMIIGLAVITAAIVVQGWFGGAMVHGMDHMNW